MKTQVAVLDYGSQYSQLIVRRIRELGFFARLYPPSEIRSLGPVAAVILSGGPRSVVEPNAPDVDLEYLKSLQAPVLGICYGMQMLNVRFGGRVTAGAVREYGPAQIHVDENNTLFNGLGRTLRVWMSHSDTVTEWPADGRILARNSTEHPVAIRWNERFYGIQFHPEVSHTEEGTKILRNFLSLCRLSPDYSIASYKNELLRTIPEVVKGREVVCAVSGGGDSTVLAVLLRESGVRMRPILVDTGLLRKNEAGEVVRNFEALGLRVEKIDAGARFLAALDGVADPEQKREIIGDLFVREFHAAAGHIELLAQGTLYPDVIESGTSGSEIASRIKTHHNRVGKILELKREGKIIEPLSDLFKDEVRELGKVLGVPPDILGRHPFPGPGLAVRIPGCVTGEKLDILREADVILIRILKQWGWYSKIWQALCVLLPVRTVGIKGDERSYEYALSVRCVISQDAMTADWADLPHGILREISNAILNGVKGVNRVLYDVSTKPPASIEWE